MKNIYGWLTVVLIGCSAAPQGAGKTDSGAGGQGGSAGSPVVEAPPDTSFGGTIEDPHPLFGTGNYAGVDLSDPCNSSQFWKVDKAIELGTGTIVIYEGTLWKLTGTSSEQWALEACTPPGTGWCADQYLWVEVGTCPAS